MILKILFLKNFRKFKNAAIEFPDGVTGVIGLNGVGKSTIFEAIAWVLYGSVAARTSSDQIKRQGSEPNDPCRVELEFIFEEDTYRVVREIKGKSFSTNATATVNGKVAATSADTVTRFIQKRLGMDFKSFFTSIFAKQKELNSLSNMNASERRPLILRMLGIDSLDDIVHEVRSDKKNKDILIEKIGEDLVDSNGKNKDDAFKEKIKELEKNNRESDKETKNLKEKIQKHKKDLQTFEKNLLKNKKEYENLNNRKEKLSEKKSLFEQKTKLQEEIKILKSKITERQKNILKEKNKIKTYDKIDADFKSCEKRLNELSVFIEKLVKKIEQDKTLINRINKDISEINLKRKNIEKLGPKAECPTCERVLSDQYDFLLKKFEKETIKNKKEVEKLESQVKKDADDKNKVVREQDALNKKRSYLEGKLREKERLNATINHLDSEIKKEQTELLKKGKMLKAIGPVVFDLKEFESVKKQIEKMYESYQKSLDIFNDQKDKLSDLTIDLEKREGQRKLIDQQIKTFQDKIKEIEKYKTQVKEEKNAVKYLAMLSDVMNDFRTFLISRIRPTLSSYSSDFFNRLTDGKYPEVELDENYDLLVYDNGEKFDINRFSGGEEDLANLCLRLAISEVITERAGGVFNFIILDEIFGSQDAFRRQNIMKALNGLSSKFRQIFLITHVDDVKNDMENIISVTENENGTSTLKID